VRIADQGRNVIVVWDEAAAAAVAPPPPGSAASGTPEERRPVYSLDMATLHVAMHDAVMIATGTQAPLIARVPTPVAPVSPEAAAHAAAYAVLAGLFPQRIATWQALRDSGVAGLPGGAATAAGLQLGATVAQQVLAARADDGRWAAMPPYVPGSAPGAFRGANPVGHATLRARPFVLTRVDQFRPPPPPALSSAAWVAEFNETRLRGGEASSRTPREAEDARFHSEPPFRFWPRNFRTFASSQPTLAENARLMALLWVAHADATQACFEAKYHYNRWRPLSAIPLADTDGNDATAPDPAWKPMLPTPNHPEYPAGHACATGAAAGALAAYFGTRRITFSFDSGVTNNRHEWTDLDAFVREIGEARILGGMHFRSATDAGEALGEQVSRWVAGHGLPPSAR
jgi:hypothetical protein